MNSIKPTDKKMCDERRGYFSEIITDKNDEELRRQNKIVADRKTKYTWRIRTPKYVPVVYHLVPPQRPRFLAPAERWMTYREEPQIQFPEETLKPKVQHMHLVEPRLLPRKVWVERRRRQYQSQSIRKLLKEMDIKPFQLIPVDVIAIVVPEAIRFRLYSKFNFLPLEIFDNEEYDSQTTDEWLNMGLLEGVQHPIPAEAFLPFTKDLSTPTTILPDESLATLYEWKNVAVTNYDHETKLYSILTLDGYQSIYKVPRIYLLFKAEDPKTFAARIKDAVNSRQEAEDRIKFEFYLDCMLVTAAHDMDEESLKRIFYMATRNKQFKIKNAVFLERVEHEIRLNYKRTLCAMQFIQCVNSQPFIYKFLKVPKKEIRPVPEKGRVAVPMADFHGMETYVKWINLYALPEVYRAMTYVALKCQKVSAMSMFTTSYGKYVTLGEFDSVQVHTTDNVIKYLKGKWLENLTLNIRMYLGDIGKGWYNLLEKQWDIYHRSKIYRFMELVKHRMQYALRCLVENSIHMLVTLVETPCQCTLDVADDFVWGKDVITTQFKPSTTAIFNILLELNEVGAFYNIDVKLYGIVLLLMYDNAIRKTHTVQQVHPFLLSNLRFPNDLTLSSVGLLDPIVVYYRAKLVLGYQKAIIPLMAYCREYDKHNELFMLDIEEYIAKFVEENHPAAEFKDEISLQAKHKRNLETTLPENIMIGPFWVNVEPLKKFLVNKRFVLYTRLLEMFTIRMRDQTEEVLVEYKGVMYKLNEKPQSIEHIFEIREWMETISVTVRTQEDTMKRLLLEYDILDHFWWALSDEDFECKWEAVGWPLKIQNQVEATNEFLDEETERYLKIQFDDEVNLVDRIDGYTSQVLALTAVKDYNKINELAVEIRRLWKNMKESQEQGLLLNQRQKLFGKPVIPFEDLNKLVKEFEPYKNLWITAADWLKWENIWMDNPLVNIDSEAIERQVNDMFKMMVRSIRVFADFPGVQQIALTIKGRIENFRPMVPLIQAVRNPGMRQRHWDDFFAESGIQIEWNDFLTFNMCLEQGVETFSESICKISESAAKEYAIELTLDKMAGEWELNLLEVTPYKATGTYIMKVAEEVLQMLDDHIVMTQQISFSPFKAAFEERINEWEDTLRVTSAVLDEWIEVQRLWMYLEPIFTSEDITRQLPMESKKYNAMDRTWRRIMKGAFELPKILDTCPDRKLLESLKDCKHMLEMVEKGLSEYLELKRSVFPRFYFLSDDELLEILSQAKNALSVQPHLKKCFENISTLTFEADLRITQMVSGDGETVDLKEPMYPTGGVEYWLLAVESSMMETVRLTLADALVDIVNKDRSEWVLSWPGQVVIAGSQTCWTGDVEEGILEDHLQKNFNIMLHTLDGLRGLLTGGISRLQRNIIGALITIEVHARDVTEKILKDHVSNINDFDWISQLRYYWIDDELKIRAVNAEFSYGNEYLGNSGRLVITPLTDRCYLTLTGALHLKFGGAPAGPAGTGKTETTKDLAKAFAIQCVVYNCSDQLDYMAMGKFFKGLASSGAWACFDEFNRIDIEVLSVVAQQVTTIQKAQLAKLERFLFEDCDIALKQSCAVFITMNPGYAGRTELPDNLKALFRPVSMMVPNYALIAEIKLFSFGFSDSKVLANKITTTCTLCVEQLSNQDHYDFGMRTVNTILAACGNLKREKPNMNERQIILRALLDVNVPKFLKDDLMLFNGIVSDLFPRMVAETVNYGDLEAMLRKITLKKGLQDVDTYIHKVIQLYETTVVRHGLMLVGPTGSGKTKCYDILRDSMTTLKGQPSPSGSNFEPCHTFVLNPKSITMGQLYGEFDLQTHEWTDGILPTLVRVGAAATDMDKRWYIFDGPVDAVWIENMNTVLDDNKKLCLTSGEIIKLKDTQTMIFEVADLAVASPATVSRCGMVYLEPSVLGLEPYMNCWLKTVPPQAVDLVESMRELFNMYVYPALHLLRTQLKELVTSVDSAIVLSFLHLMEFRLRPLTSKDGKPPPGANFQALMPDLLVPWVAFSLIWSIGNTCDNPSREIFSVWLVDLMKEYKHGPPFPKQGVVYDYKLHDGGFTDQTSDGEPAPATWRSWLENVDEFVITPDTKYSDIEIPTIDKVRNAEMLGMLLMNENNVLCLGPTGTGKTLTISAKLGRQMHKKFICDFIIFSARTSSNQTQDLIDSKLEKRRKGVYGPPLLKWQVFFIDDFNMPALETYGAQPPIELIRQWMDFKGWYDRKEIGVFRHIIDVNFVAAMGPPGGGRNPVTARLLRHYHYLIFTEMEDSSKTKIFGRIFASWLDRTSGFMSVHEAMVRTTLNVYTIILQELLPTPAKTHYTFNLRDLSKVFQGMLMVNPENISEVGEIYCLWYHECCRVFQDRLVNDIDRNWFDALLREKIKTEFNADPVSCLGTETLIYGDYLEMSYNRITDMQKLIRTLNEHLEEYNSQTTKPMKLVLFLDAICHVSGISRVIRQPMGNSLLLGMGGSGRQSLTRMATHIAEFFCFQIELSKTYGTTEWRDDIKTLMLKAGLQNRETVFLFTDSQIKSESFLEDLNNILNSGDVPNIYQSDELDKIFMGMKGIVQEMGLPATKSNLFSAYQKQVRANLHTVITMSPIGEIFRARLRQFPALVNCCTIDWFSAWPDSALQSVAIQFLDDIEELSVSDEILNGIVVMCQHMHQSVVNASIKFLQELSRHNYVTPTSYLELLSSYSSLLGKKKGELTQGIRRLKSGLDKLVTTGEEVKVLQVQLKDMKPALEIAAADAEVMIAQIAEDTKVAEETKSVVEKEENEASKKAEITQAIADDAQKDLDEAMPALLAAEESLKALNKNDITEVRTMKRPPAGVLLVIEALCIVRDIKPNKIPGNMPGEKILDYWEPGRAMMSDPGGFLTSMMNFDKSTITEPMIEKLTVYCNNPLFEPAKIIKVSKACTSLCMWVHAMYKYYFVDKAVAPKKAALAQANIELQEVEAALAVTKAKMQAIMKGLADLNDKLNAKIAYKEEQENNINLCEARMGRAVRLVGGLADERVRWLQTIEQLEAGVINVIGDILISSGCVAYLSPFTDKYRRELLTDWQEVLAEKRVPHTSKCNPVSTLGEAVTIRQWQLDGLPRDFLSTENAVLVTNSRRWPLFIDPQGQANKWVRNMGKAFGLAVCKLADKDLLRTMESAIRFGKPCLIENVGTELDPALDPILQKQIFKQGGTPVLKLGDVTVPYNDDFRLYITTKLPNPHYTPEISIKVLVVNFTLVPSGLQDQMLALVVMQERPDLEEARSLLVVSSAQMKQELKEIEDRILYKLSASEGSPVDDIDLILTLESSKVKSTEIKLKVAAAEITQVDIDTTRALYIPVANRAQILFFCLLDLSTVDPMYQYSLEWFTSIFVNSMANTEKSTDINERVETINNYFTFSLYTSVCRSLFEKHKLHFAFLLCIRIMMDEERISPEEWHYFLSSGLPLHDRPNPASAWLEARAWLEILALENLKTFAQFVEDFPEHVNAFYQIFQSGQPHREPFPAPWDARLDDFQQMMILKCIRPDRVTNAMQDFLCTHLGQRFVEPQTSDLSLIYKDSSPQVPLIFVLSTGTDPAAELYKFADKMKFSSRLNGISLGQGQGPRAEKLMEEALEIGSWVFFQNCHLAPSWMPRLERLIETIDLEVVHKDFRVWLTSTPSPHFPVAILQNGSKMTVEPPRGVKANMLRSYTSKVTEFSDFFHSDGEKVPPFKWLLFALCLFHGACIERRKFGPLGFNIPYEFTDGDLRICISQLHMFLVEYTEIPFKVLTYTAGHINYGGRVTDDWDRRCLLNILGDYYSPNVLDENFKFDSEGSYHQLPSTSNLAKYLSYIREELPLNDDPDLFGLHANADISCARAETYRCLETLLALQPKVVSSGGASQEEVTAGVANHILSQIPDLFNVDDVTERYPMLYEESLNTVLIQETMRFNKLLVIIRSSLTDLLKALKGLVVMSEALESMAASLFKNGVPTMWSAKAYPSLKPLGSWVTDLRARVDFLNKWIDEGIPAIIWISGLYSSQAFLTGTKQNFARKHIVSIDTIEFAFQVMEVDPTERPEDGCNIWGLFLEAARWNYVTHFLDESRPKELYTQMPVIWMIPEEHHQVPSGIYESPVYKTLTRAGTLTTTGHSTNFVVVVEVPSQKTQRHWIKRGCALICALDY